MIRSVCLLSLGVLLAAIRAESLRAEDSAARFAPFITAKTAETFHAVRQFLETAPEAEQEAAYRWLFETAADYGWESQVLAEAEKCTQQPGLSPAVAALAEQVRMLGLAQSDRREEAVQAYQLSLRKHRLRSSNQVSDFGQSLAMQLQLAGDREAALAVYEKLSGAFFLNPDVKDWCDRRTRRLELFGKPAPEITGATLAGQPFDAASLRGKVTLVDFWATNCKPCLEELPKLRELYAEYHSLGLEVVGISFDEDSVALTEFLERQPLPWTILLNDKFTAPRYQVELIPCLVLLDGAGQVVVTDVRVPQLRGALHKLLSPPSEARSSSRP